VLVLGRRQVRQVRLGAEERERDVESIRDVFLGGADLGQDGDVAHAVVKELDLHRGLGDDDSAGAAAVELGVPLAFEAVAFFLADHFIRANNRIGYGPMLKLGRKAIHVHFAEYIGTFLRLDLQ
jgi:hypothetical protein